MWMIVRIKHFVQNGLNVIIYLCGFQHICPSNFYFIIISYLQIELFHNTQIFWLHNTHPYIVKWLLNGNIETRITLYNILKRIYYMTEKKQKQTIQSGKETVTPYTKFILLYHTSFVGFCNLNLKIINTFSF